MSRDAILMLEDNAERIERFQIAIERLGRPLRIWRSTGPMLQELESLLPSAALIALDHDLEPADGEPTDPGDGLIVAKWLAERPPVCPVLIHTSNTFRGDAMEGELDLAGWTYRRILPVGDDWIEVDWYRAARRLLLSHRRGRR